MADDEEASGRAPRSAAFVVAAVLAGVFLATTVLLAVVAVGLKQDNDELETGRSAVQEAAGRFVDAFLEYDYRRLDELEDVVALTAPPFTEQFEQALPGLREAATASEHVSSGVVQDVFVAEVDGEDATAIVVYDRTLDGVGGPRQETNRYLRLGLVERDGRWLVNDVIDLNIAFAGTGSTTTVPG